MVMKTVELLPLVSKHDSDPKILLNGDAPVHGKKAQSPLLAGACFCLASGSMTLFNKAALSSFDFDAPIAILIFQCFFCAAMVKLFATFGVVAIEPLNARLVRCWYPVNIIFVGMLVTSFWSLEFLTVPMSTVLKNLTNFIIIVAEYVLYKKVYNRYIWGTIALMFLSAIAGAFTDLAFNLAGYFWQIVNSGFTAAYTLSLKVSMDKVKEHTITKERLSEFSLVYINNLLSLPLLLAVFYFRGEADRLWSQPDLYNPAFLVVAMLGGVVSFAISFSVLWFLSTTTPTTFSLVGSLNKIIVSVIGLFLFESVWSSKNLASVSVGLLAGALFTYAKQKN